MSIEYYLECMNESPGENICIFIKTRDLPYYANLLFPCCSNRSPLSQHQEIFDIWLNKTDTILISFNLNNSYSQDGYTPLPFDSCYLEFISYPSEELLQELDDLYLKASWSLRREPTDSDNWVFYESE